MQTSTRRVIEQCAADSAAGAVSFGDVVGRLMEAGVESYFADYRARLTTYYLPSGESHAIALAGDPVAIGDAFDAAAVQAAIRGAQRGEVMYPEFKWQTRAAGCIGYFVWIAGRRVDYYGRRGEAHIEHFPD